MKKILLVHIEPTTYLIDLLNTLVTTWHGQMDVIFLAENKSQNWNIELNNKWMMMSPKRTPAKIQTLISLLLKNKYDIVHVAGWGEPLCLLVVLLAKFLGIPVSVESDTPLPNLAPFWKRMIKRLVYPQLFKIYNVFIPGGSRQINYLKYYGAKAERIVASKMTVDVSKIQIYLKNLDEDYFKKIRVNYQIPTDHVVLLYVGRLEDYKGIIDLIDGFNKVQCEKICLLIVGDGTLKPFVENESKLNNKIKYVGRLSGNDLLDSYYISNVLILPSRFEAWGLVVNEAMAAGKPVIVSDRVGCIDDLVEHNSTGIIVKAECVEEIKNAIEYIFNTSSELLQMGKKAAEKIKDWTLENEAKNICQAWKQLANQ